MSQQTNSIQNLLEQPPIKSERKRSLLLGTGAEDPQNRLEGACFRGSVPSKFSQILQGVHTPLSSQNISESGTPNQLSSGGISLEVGLEEQGFSFGEPSSENGTQLLTQVNNTSIILSAHFSLLDKAKNEKALGSSETSVIQAEEIMKDDVEGSISGQENILKRGGGDFLGSSVLDKNEKALESSETSVIQAEEIMKNDVEGSISGQENTSKKEEIGSLGLQIDSEDLLKDQQVTQPSDPLNIDASTLGGGEGQENLSPQPSDSDILSTSHVSNQESKRLNIDPKEAELSNSEEEAVTIFSGEMVVTGKHLMGRTVGEGALLSPNPLAKESLLMGQAKAKGEENNTTNKSAISFDEEEEIGLPQLRGEGMVKGQNILSPNQTAMPQAANPAASLISHPYSYLALNQLHQQQVVLRQQQALNKEVSAHSEEADSGSLTSMSGSFEGGGDKISRSPIQYASITHAMTSKKWGEALGKHLQVAASQSLQKMQITLNPEKLGPIQVNLHLSKDKQLHIGLAAHHVATREAMLEALPRLREMLESQGVSLGSMDVSDEGLAQQDFTKNPSDQKGQSSDARLSQETEVLSENVSTQALLNAIDEQGRVDYYA